MEKETHLSFGNTDDEREDGDRTITSCRKAQTRRKDGKNRQQGGWMIKYCSQGEKTLWWKGH